MFDGLTTEEILRAVLKEMKRREETLVFISCCKDGQIFSLTAARSSPDLINAVGATMKSLHKICIENNLDKYRDIQRILEESKKEE